MTSWIKEKLKASLDAHERGAKCYCFEEGFLVRHDIAQEELRNWKIVLQTNAKNLEQANKMLAEALEYYAHPDHYEPRITLGGERPPGVLVEQGDKAREVLKQYKKLMMTSKRDYCGAV